MVQRIMITIVLYATSLCLMSPLYSTIQQPWVIVLDPTDTLFRVDQSAIQGEVSDASTSFAGALYSFWHLSTNPQKDIEKGFLQLLQSFGTQQGNTAQLIRDQDHKPVPLILVQWLSGQITSKRLIAMLIEHSDDRVFKKIAKKAFDPYILARHTHIISGALSFVVDCCALVGANYVYITGNWDAESFQLLSADSPCKQLFTYIAASNRLISGNSTLLLPRDARAIFTIITQKTKVPYSNILFVSNMEYHRIAAEALGIKTYAGNNLRLVLQQITKLCKPS